LQYLFFWQFGRLRAYAAGRGVKLIGDLPIYVSPQSADLWANAQLFQTDENNRLTRVAGVPPDAFSNDGQLWGNPLYDWDVMRADNFAWWKKRMRAAADMFDMVRLDHFRAFDQYWSVDVNSNTAQNGSWQAGPGIALFEELKKEIGDYPVIAEDLGTITDSVRALRRQTGYLGMRVMQFGFVDESDNEHLPHRHASDLAIYTGTHDNDTLQNFVRQLSFDLRVRCRDYFGVENGSETNALLRAAFSSVASLCIVPMQDLPGVMNPKRMNTPATVSQSNWSWRLNKNEPNAQTTHALTHFNALYGRD
jgi:4-alpha-glucanotransferase